MIPPTHPASNRLLAALCDADRQRLWPQLECVHLQADQTLHESGTPQTHMYFPTSALVSLLYLTEDGASSEIAVVGNEGFVGCSLLLGGVSGTSHGMVQCAGYGFRIAAGALEAEFERSGPLRQLLLRYILAAITQMSQTAACNRHHRLEQQVCRWLLQRLDRQPDGEVVTTQQRLADMLGVRREGVTAVALKLQAAGLIRYARGHVSVLDRAGLERRTCECYSVVREEYARLLPPEQPEQAAQPVFTAGRRRLTARSAYGFDRRTQPAESNECTN